MATIGKLAVQITADTQGLKTGLSDAVGETDRASKNMVDSIKVIGAAFASLGVVSALTDMVKSAAAAGREIDQLSRLSNTSAANFQAQAYAAQQFGISTEKLADIFKDVQDKVGDFMQNGAGPLADFFTNIAPKVGVTADQFRNLGGPDALQLYVSSLERANLSQSEMTFYLEAIASDSALLLPLLQNNGKAMKDLGDEAQRLGAILDNETIEANKEFAAQLDRLNSLSTSLSRTIGSALIPEINRLINEMVTGIETAGGFWNALSVFGTINPFKDLQGNLKSTRAEIDSLTAAKERYVKAGSDTSGIDQALATEKLRLEYLKSIERQQIANQKGAANNESGAESMRLGLAAPTTTPRAAPTIESPDQKRAAEEAKKLAEKSAQEAKDRAQEVDDFFVKVDGAAKQREVDKMSAFMEALKTREDARLQEGLTEQRRAEEQYAKELEQLLAAKEKLALTEEEFSERLLQIRMDRDERIMDADLALLDNEKQIADERVRINKQAEQLITNAREASANAAIGLLSALGGKSKAAAVAAIALGKALSISQIIQNTAVAQMRALAELGPIAGSAAAAKIGVMGKVQMGLVAATGLVQAAGVISGGSQSLSAGNTIQSTANSSSPNAMQANSMAPAAMNQTITVQGIGSDALFSGDAVRTLIDRLIDAQRNGARIVLA